MKKDDFIQKIKENWKVKIICILIAVITYLVCQISFLDKKTFAVHPQVINSSNLTYVNEIPRFFRISVRGIPADIALLKENDFDLFINLNDYAEPGKYRVPLSFQLSEKATKMEKIEVSVEPESIELILEPKVTALIPLKSNISGNCAKGYEISSFNLSPDVVQVVGSKSLVEKTTFLETSPINVNGKSSDFTQKVNVINYNNRLILSDIKEVTASVKIIPIRITKQVESSEIFYYSLKDGFAIENSENTYKITVSGNKNELDNFVLSPLSVQVDCSNISTTGIYELPLMVIVPDGITVDKIEPNIVEITVVDFIELPKTESTEELLDDTNLSDLQESTENAIIENNSSLPIIE